MNPEISGYQMIDKDSLIIAGIVLLTAFWIFMVKAEAGALINTVMGGLLGYLGASSKNPITNPDVPLPPNVVTGMKASDVKP